MIYLRRVILLTVLACWLQSVDGQVSKFFKPTVGPWMLTNEPEFYAGDDLFFLIDGGADVYLEYGFREVAVSGYSDGNRLVRVEVYLMTNAASAWGVFSARRPFPPLPGSSEYLALGKGYLMGVEGDCYIVVSSDDDELEYQWLIDFFKLFTHSFPEVENFQLSEFFPKATMQALNGVLFLGRAGFSSVYTLGAYNFNHFDKGMAWRFSSDSTRIILRYVNMELAAGDFKAFRAATASTDRFTHAYSDTATLIVCDRKKTILRLSLNKDEIKILISPAKQ